MTDNLKRIQKIYNAHERELLRVLELTKNEHYLELIYFYSKLKYHGFFIPSTFSEVLQILERVKVKDKKTGQIGYVNQAYGFLINEGEANYGVQWYSGKQSISKLPFWQPRYKFKIL